MAVSAWGFLTGKIPISAARTEMCMRRRGRTRVVVTCPQFASEAARKKRFNGSSFGNVHVQRGVRDVTPRRSLSVYVWVHLPSVDPSVGSCILHAHSLTHSPSVWFDSDVEGGRGRGAGRTMGRNWQRLVRAHYFEAERWGIVEGLNLAWVKCSSLSR